METVNVKLGEFSEPISFYENEIEREESGGKVGTIQFERLWIDITSIPAYLDVPDKKKLIVLRHLHEEPSFEITDFAVTGREKYAYEILLDPNQIRDNHKHDRDEAIIKFTLYRKQQGWLKKPESKEFEVKLNLHKALPHICATFKLHDDFTRPFPHEKKKVPLGELLIENTTSVTYSDVVTCEVTTMVETPGTRQSRWDVMDFQQEPIRNDAASANAWKSSIKTKQHGPRYIISPVPPEKAPGPMFHLSEGQTASHDFQNFAQVKGLAPKTKLTLPVYIDIGRIENPVEDAEYNAIIKLEYNIEKRPDRLSQKIIITQDKTITALMAQIEAQGIKEYCDRMRQRELRLPSNILWDVQHRRGLTTCFTFTLGNYAQSAEGAVYIKNFRMRIDDIPEMRPHAVQQLFRITVNNQPVDSPPPTYCFPSNAVGVQKFAIALQNDAIEDIPDDLAPVRCQISFDYSETGSLKAACTKNTDHLIIDPEQPEMQDDLNWQPFAFDVAFMIEKYLGSHWLAVDFGTSAIVAKFGDEVDQIGNARLLNLQTVREKLVKKSQDYTKDQIAEFGMPFLDSTILLRSEGMVATDIFDKNIVLLSPLRSVLEESLNYLLPYLKALIGTAVVPNFNGRLDKYKYIDQDGDMKEFSVKPLEVRLVLANAYQVLLRHYIGDILQQQRHVDQFHKMIISVPNTFTSRHTEHIRQTIIHDQMIKQTFKRQLHENQIAFISESDTVACYYIAQWPHLNQCRTQAERDEYRTGVEHVLVYDMGAGTVDLTYFQIIGEDDGQRQQVNVIGRFGKATAGNYLDYDIARYLNEKYSDKFKNSIFGYSTGNFQFQCALKKFIKEEIKPRLNHAENLIDFQDVVHEWIKPDEKLMIPAEEIRDSEEVTEFIRKNTQDLFTHFFALYQNIDGKPRQKGEFEIDTLVFSGRGLLFQKLRDAIQDEVAQWTKSKKVFSVIIGDEQTLKSAVVQGALEYALSYRDQTRANVRFHSLNLHARYGVSYRDPHDPLNRPWQFAELISPATKPINEKAAYVLGGTMMYEYYAETMLDLTNTTKGYFVQSYSMDTAQDMQNGNTEYITKIFEFTKAQIPGNLKKVRIGMRINANSDITVIFGDFEDEPTSPLRIDWDEEEQRQEKTFKQSMWPYLD